MRRKLFTRVVMILMVLTLMLPAFSATAEKHKHDWKERGRVDATCTEEGRISYYCSCGKTKTEPIPVLGHKWDGGSVTTAATCTANGVKTFTCTRCGKTKTEQIAATGHKWNSGVVTTAATCSMNGVKTYTCSGCGETKTEQLPMLEHEWGKWQRGVEPTCEGKGKDYSVCANCGQTRYRDNIDPLGHDWDEGVVISGTGILEDKEVLYTCNRCEKTKTEIIPAEVTEDPYSISSFMDRLRWKPTTEIETDEELTILAQPVGGMIDRGSGRYELNVEVAGGTPGYSYDWRQIVTIKGHDYDTSVAGNHDESGISSYPAKEAGRYYCVITDMENHQKVSDTVMVYDTLLITEQPKNASLPAAERMSCAAKGGVPPYTYKWGISDGNGGMYVIEGATEDTFCPAEYNIEGGSRIVCFVYDNENNVTSTNSAMAYDDIPLTVICNIPIYLRKGETAEFCARVAGGVEPYTVTWLSNGTTPSPTEQRDNGAYYTTEVSYGGYRFFRCVVTDKIGNTAECESFYDYKPLQITQQPKGGGLPRGGGEHTLTISVKGGKAPYTFTLNHPTGENQVKESKGEECFFIVTEPDWYDIYVEDAEGNYAYSEIAVVTDYDFVHIADYTDCVWIEKPNGGATLSVTPEGGQGPYSYKWEIHHGEYYEKYQGFKREELGNVPSVTVYEPGAVLSCTVTDQNGDTAYVGGMKVDYSGGIWILKQPQNVALNYQENDSYSFSIDCEVVGGSTLRYQWFAINVQNGYEYPVTGQRGSYGGCYYEKRGNENQISGKYYCVITDDSNGQSVKSDSASVNVEMRAYFEKVSDRTYMFDVKGGCPPYYVCIKIEASDATEKAKEGKSVSKARKRTYEFSRDELPLVIDNEKIGGITDNYWDGIIINNCHIEVTDSFGNEAEADMK